MFFGGEFDVVCFVFVVENFQWVVAEKNEITSSLPSHQNSMEHAASKSVETPVQNALPDVASPCIM